MTKRRTKRAGYMLAAVLACLSLVLALTVAALQTALRMRREIVKQHLVSQTTLLCETGLVRAARRQQEAEYTGETWKPLLPELPGKQAEVSIVFLERGTTHSTVQVIASIEDPLLGNSNRVQRSLTTRLVHEILPETSQGENP